MAYVYLLLVIMKCDVIYCIMYTVLQEIGMMFSGSNVPNISNSLSVGPNLTHNDHMFNSQVIIRQYVNVVYNIFNVYVYRNFTHMHAHTHTHVCMHVCTHTCKIQC